MGTKYNCVSRLYSQDFVLKTLFSDLRHFVPRFYSQDFVIKTLLSRLRWVQDFCPKTNQREGGGGRKRRGGKKN